MLRRPTESFNLPGRAAEPITSIACARRSRQLNGDHFIQLDRAGGPSSPPSPKSERDTRPERDATAFEFPSSFRKLTQNIHLTADYPAQQSRKRMGELRRRGENTDARSHGWNPARPSRLSW